MAAHPSMPLRRSGFLSFMGDMKSLTAFLFCLFICGLPLGASGWVWLFDGESLDGWVPRGGEATYAVVDGAIVGTNGPGPNTFLCTKRTFADFELEFEVYLKDALNSGVQIRSKVREESRDGVTRQRVFGPQVEIELSPGEAGYLYGEAAGGWMTPEDRRAPHGHFRNGQWNQYRVVARGSRIQVFLNGVQVSDLVDEGIHESHSEGLIGLQVHSTREPAGTLQVKWRNIRIREIPTEGWISLFDGESLDGWIPKVTGHPAGENPRDIFRVRDGLLVATHESFDAFGDRFGHLFYGKPFSRYRLRLEYRFTGDQQPGAPDWAYRNNGVMLHAEDPAGMELNQKFPDSLEMQFLGADAGEVRPTGNVCSPGTFFFREGRRVEEHCLNAESPSLPGNQWVLAEVWVDGSGEVVHFINGREVLRYQDLHRDDGTELDRGFIALQAESHPTEFRAIELLPLD